MENFKNFTHWNIIAEFLSGGTVSRKFLLRIYCGPCCKNYKRLLVVRVKTLNLSWKQKNSSANWAPMIIVCYLYQSLASVWGDHGLELPRGEGVHVTSLRGHQQHHLGPGQGGKLICLQMINKFSPHSWRELGSWFSIWFGNSSSVAPEYNEWLNQVGSSAWPGNIDLHLKRRQQKVFCWLELLQEHLVSMTIEQLEFLWILYSRICWWWIHVRSKLCWLLKALHINLIYRAVFVVEWMLRICVFRTG